MHIIFFLTKAEKHGPVQIGRMLGVEREEKQISEIMMMHGK